MKRNFILVFFALFLVKSGFAQTSLKANLQTMAFAVPNVGFETKLNNKISFQLDVTASFWKSIRRGPYEFVLLVPEFRYYTKEVGKGFFIGVHIGGSAYKVQKWNYLDTDYYQKGYGIMYGATTGYQFQLNDKLNLEVFLGGGHHSGFYKGYSISTDERVDTARNYNKSGEFIPYRGGIMLVYKLK